MFLTILLNAIFCVVICKISFFCSKFTTVAKYDWFQDLIFSLEKFAKNKIKSQKAEKFILKASYSKAFSCRPCHCFWISLGLFYTLFCYQSINYAFVISVILAIVVHLMAKGLDAETQDKG